MVPEEEYANNKKVEEKEARSMGKMTKREF